VPPRRLPHDKQVIGLTEYEKLITDREIVNARFRTEQFRLQFVFRGDRIKLLSHYALRDRV